MTTRKKTPAKKPPAKRRRGGPPTPPLRTRTVDPEEPHDLVRMHQIAHAHAICAPDMAKGLLEFQLAMRNVSTQTLMDRGWTAEELDVCGLGLGAIEMFMRIGPPSVGMNELELAHEVFHSGCEAVLLPTRYAGRLFQTFRGGAWDITRMGQHTALMVIP